MELQEKRAQAIRENRTVLGIELGSTRIKAVLIDDTHAPIASGSHAWENQLVDGVWTYSMDAVWAGLQDAYSALAADVRARYGVVLTRVGAIGISAMMHGYIALDKTGALLVPFRTWRNTMTKEAADRLTALFSYPIPQRWSIAHLYQAIRNGEPHVRDIHYLITLEGYVHWKLTGRRVLGIGDVAGMFPVDVDAKDFDRQKMAQFDALVADANLPWKLADILPKALVAGEDAGTLSAEGAALLDVSGNLMPGIPLCPPEGDAGTGMAATNSVAVRTGNVSAGTSVFAMAVLEHPLKRVHPELDLVTTPAGDLVAMVHCNNCTSDLNAWIGLFGEAADLLGVHPDPAQLYTLLYQKALTGDADCGGLLAYNYVSGEHITGCAEGRPLFVRTPDSRFTLANFMRCHLYTALGALKTGMDILFNEESVGLDVLMGHGGLFKTEGVAQRILASAIGVPVAVMETAGEGGAWGCALLGAYRIWKQEGQSLSSYLADRVFGGQTGSVMAPDETDAAGFARFMERYRSGLAIEQSAIAHLRSDA